MTQQIERRKAERRTDEEDLSPEYLELLEVCGGEIRARDRAVLAERRKEGAPGASVIERTASAEAIVPVEPTRAASGQTGAVETSAPRTAPISADRRAQSG
jgi:hypothetical protein